MSIAEIYYYLVKNKKRDIKQVPAKVRQMVQALLDADEDKNVR